MMGGAGELGAIIAAVGGALTGILGIVFGYLGKREVGARESLGEAKRDADAATERVDELERQLDVVVTAYFAQRRHIADLGAELLPVPPEMRRSESP